MSLIEHLDRVYADRRDRYGYTVLSRSRAIRAIKRPCDEAMRRLINTELLDILVSEKCLLPSRVVRGAQDKYIFLVQKRIRPAVVPSEWSPTMFADAAILLLHAEYLVYQHGMTVDDPHPWNILFDEGKPYVIDIGSFNVVGTGLHWSAKMDADIWPAGNAFYAFFLNVVALVAAGRGHYVRRALTDWNPISGTDTALLLLKKPATLLWFLAIRLYLVVFQWAWRLLIPAASVSLKNTLKSLHWNVLSRYVNQMRSVIVRMRACVDTGANISAGVADAIRTFIGQHSSQRCLVYGPNLRIINYITALGVTKLFVVSPDEALIDSLYDAAPGCVAGAVMDLRSPTSGAGPSNRWILPAVERFKSEVGVFFFDLEELVIDKCLTVFDLIQAARNMSEVGALIVFGKLPSENGVLGRNYGQTEDHVLMSCLEQNLKSFVVIQNDSREMVVSFGHNDLSQAKSPFA